MSLVVLTYRSWKVMDNWVSLSGWNCNSAAEPLFETSVLMMPIIGGVKMAIDGFLISESII